MSRAQDEDYFSRARRVAVAALLAAAAVAIIGSFLDWVTIEPPSRVPENQVARTRPFSGVDIGDGWWVIVAAAVVVIAALLLYARGRAGYAWLAFLASIVIGAIAISDYRGIGDAHSAISRRTERVGEVEPALGITLVAAAALVGVVGAVAGVAASPRTDDYSRSSE